MRTTDEVYIKLNELYWKVLSENRDVSRFKDEFFDVCLNDGYELEQIEEYWRM